MYLLESSTRAAAGTCPEQTQKLVILHGRAILAPTRVYAWAPGTALCTALRPWWTFTLAKAYFAEITEHLTLSTIVVNVMSFVC